MPTRRRATYLLSSRRGPGPLLSSDYPPRPNRKPHSLAPSLGSVARHRRPACSPLLPPRATLCIGPGLCQETPLTQARPSLPSARLRLPSPRGTLHIGSGLRARVAAVLALRGPAFSFFPRRLRPHKRAEGLPQRPSAPPSLWCPVWKGPAPPAVGATGFFSRRWPSQTSAPPLAGALYPSPASRTASLPWRAPVAAGEEEGFLRVSVEIARRISKSLAACSVCDGPSGERAAKGQGRRE